MRAFLGAMSIAMVMGLAAPSFAGPTGGDAPSIRLAKFAHEKSLRRNVHAVTGEAAVTSSGQVKVRLRNFGSARKVPRFERVNVAGE